MNARQVQYNRNCEILKKYVPESAVEVLAAWIIEFDFKLKIKKERSTRLGDYTPPRDNKNHLITINYNLNRFAFLVTLVHEIAHLVTYNSFKNRVLPHGKEWKENFRRLMTPFFDRDVFPPDLLYALRKYLQNPAASSCSDPLLQKALRLYDEQQSNKIFLEYLPAGSVFLHNGSRLFKKGEKIRTRIKCTELNSGQVYLFSSLAEVEVFESASVLPD